MLRLRSGRHLGVGVGVGSGWADRPLPERGWAEILRLRAQNDKGERVENDMGGAG